MILDAFFKFTASGGDSPTTGTETATNILDLGLTGIPTSANGGGARDLGIGDDPALKLLANVTVAFVGGTSLQLVLAGAPDNGSGAPGSYTTMYTGPAIVEASLVVGARLGTIDFPRPVAGQAMPRYIRLQYVTVGTHTAGTLEAAFVLDRQDQPSQAAGYLGAYPAGLTVAN